MTGVEINKDDFCRKNLIENLTISLCSYPFIKLWFLLTLIGFSSAYAVTSDSKVINTVDKKKAVDSAMNGLDFLVRHQVKNSKSADYGRFASQYDCKTLQVQSYTTNWTTGICLEVMLIGHKLTGNKEYLEAAEQAAEYIASLQYFAPENRKMHGVIREQTPQTLWAHPRDALTAAWAMLDYAQYTGQKEYLERSVLYADWLVKVGMEKGYPYWTVRMDGASWEPQWSGSFQSGGAFYFYRLFNVTGNTKYKDAMFKILDYYNEYHIDETGRIYVAVDMQTKKSIVAYEVNPKYSNLGWEVMHEYNDDFGALANLAGYELSKNEKYLDSAKNFLNKMVSMQRKDGGFGPEKYSVPSAGGSVLLELLAAQKIGFKIATDQQINQAVKYVLSLQVNDSQSPAYGAFRGFNAKYEVSEIANARTIAYSIMGLFRYAGVTDLFYFLD